MNLSLQNKQALVCGSTQGIGRAAAVELALLGANVVLFARNEEVLETVRASLDTSKGQQHTYLVADFSRPELVKSVIQPFAETQPLHILVNNTGGPPGGPAVDAAPDEFLQAFSNHLVCNQVLVQAVVAGMKTAGYGRIINIISTSVKTPLKGLGVSNTIRGAVASWAKTLAAELGPFGITVNNMLPGFTDTARLDSLINSRAEKENRSAEDIRQEMTDTIPAARIGEATEIAAAIAFLATPAAAYINGINLPVDGGKTPSL